MSGMHNDIGAVVLAAGNGTRMGVPKLLLQKDGKSYLEHILNLLCHEKVEPVVSIIGKAQDNWARQFTDKTKIIVNPHPEHGMLSSIQLGVAALQTCSGLFIVPVDHPFISGETLQLLKQSAAQNPDAVVKPLFKKQSGHPIILPHAFFNAIHNAAPDFSLRTLIHHTNLNRIYAEVNDEGILKNINEWYDLQE